MSVDQVLCVCGNCFGLAVHHVRGSGLGVTRPAKFAVIWFEQVSKMLRGVCYNIDRGRLHHFGGELALGGKK